MNKVSYCSSKINIKIEISLIRSISRRSREELRRGVYIEGLRGMLVRCEVGVYCLSSGRNCT